MSTSERGFALAAVLWLLAGLTILAAMISQSSQTSAERQMRLRQRVDAEQEFLSSRSESLYWLASSVATQDGFGWGNQLLRVDARSYAASDAKQKGLMQIQDVRGLLDLNQPNRARLTRLLLHCGAQEGQTDALLDALEDYIDKDNLKRLNGAEAMEYSAAGLAPPRNGPLLAEQEIWKVFGWARLQSVWEDKHCFEDVTIRGDSRLNMGTATAAVLESEGLSAEQVAQVLGQRSLGDNTLIDLIQARIVVGGFISLPEGRWPARSFRVTHLQPGLPWMLRYELKLTTNLAGTPWEISAPRRLPQVAAIASTGGAKWPELDKISETDKNAITKPVLPF